MSKPSEESRRTGSDWRSGEALRVALERRLAEAAPDANTGAPPSIPDHTLLRRIGSGAYGEVWLALNALGTLRAVKIVYRAHFKEDRPYEREFNGILKYEPVSRTHEGLMQVLHVGRNDERGYFYYVMELADEAVESDTRRLTSDSEIRSPKPEIRRANEPSDVGCYNPRTLRSDLARGERLLPADAAQFVLRLASALGHLHAHGLVHRDIKPSNIIFVAGQPKLADIGLVTDVGSSHSFVGTEGFIPPEGPGTPRADLYGLGKLLYELATGRDRMDFPQLPAGVAQLRDGEALLELNEVMTRACAPDPQQRYATATELQAELNLFLAGRSLRRARHVERHLARLKRFTVAACAFLVLAAVALWFSKREDRHARERVQEANERARVEAESRAKEAALRTRAEAAEHEARQQLYTALLGQARATVRSGELGHRVRALDALRRAAAISNTVELRREVFAALALPDLRFERELPTGSGVTIAQLDPAFGRLALCRGRGPVEIRSVSDHRLLTSLTASTNLPAHFVRWSLDGRFLAIKRDHDPGGQRADLEVWEVASDRRVLLLRDVSWGLVSFHPRLPQMMTALCGGTVAVCNLEDGNELTRFTLPAVPFHLKYSPDGRRFAIAYDRQGRGFVAVHNAADAAPLASQVIPHGVSSVDWDPSGRWIALGGDDGSVNVIDSRSGVSRKLGHHKANAVLMAFSPDGGYLVSGGWEREFICWDLQAMRRSFTMPLGSFNLQFRRDGRECAVVTDAGVQLHAFERPINHREFAEDLGARLALAAFSPDGRWLAASSHDRLGVWDLKGRGPGALTDEATEARPFFTPDGSELFGSSRHDECFRWRITPGTNAEAAPQLQRLDLPKLEGFTSLCLISNAVAMTDSRGTRLVDPNGLAEANGRWARTSPGISGASPDGRWLGIYHPFTPSLYVYRLPGLEQVAKLTQPDNVGTFKFSPLGDEVAISSRGRVEFWSTTSWERTRVITNFVRILYSPDARTWWLTKDSLMAGLYDARTVEPLLPLPTGMLPLALSPDGRHLAVSVDALRLQVWDLVEVRNQLRELGMDWDNERSEVPNSKR